MVTWPLMCVNIKRTSYLKGHLRHLNILKIVIIFTTVHPLFILCKSLCEWAQKSTQAVTPENGREGFEFSSR